MDVDSKIFIFNLALLSKLQNHTPNFLLDTLDCPVDISNASS